MKYLLKNGTVISGAGTRKQDVLVEGEKIIKVGEELSQPDAKVVDVSGKLLFPGFIDGHTHFDLEVAGTVTADDFETGTRAAILGGTTLVIDFASQDKGGHTLKEGLEKWHKKADGKCSCDYSFHMSIVEWNEETKKEIQDMINKGVNTFVEVGPGKALRGFVKKIDKNSRLLNVEDMESLNNALNELKEGR